MKKCKFCQSDIDDKAIICPVCKGKQKKNLGGLIATGVCVYIVIMIIIIAAVSDTTSDSSISSVNTSSLTATSENIDLIIDDAYITEDIIGQNQVNLSVKNNSQFTVDAYDYKVEAYNSYGEKINNLTLNSFTATDITIAPGENFSGVCTMYFADTATIFKVAITRYHTKENNKTIEVKSKNRVWVEVRK